MTDARGIQEGGFAELAVRQLQRFMAGFQQLLQRARIARLVFAEAAQAGVGFHGKALGGAFGKVHETHDLYLAVILFQGFSKR
ncbi:hypothetical protein D9M71_334870 [compost metagenome]